MTRKISAMILVVLLVLAMAPMAAQAEYVQTLNAGGTLNLREGPGKEYGVGGYVQDGDAITLTGYSDVDAENYTWCEVEVARTGKTGFIKEMYIVDSWKAQKVKNKSIHIENGTAIIVRSGPGTGYGILDYVYENDRVTVISGGSVWAKVKLDKNGVVGYIKHKYIYGYSGYTPVEPTPKTGTASVTGNGVYLRSGPGTGYSALTSLYYGNKVTVNGKSGNWYSVVTSSGIRGYIYSKYISFQSTAYVTANMNMRAGAGTGYGIYCVVPKGSTVKVLGYNGNWSKVSYGGYTGYVYTSYIANR